MLGKANFTCSPRKGRTHKETMWIKRLEPIWYIGIYFMRRENHCYFNLLQCQCEDCSTNLFDLPKKKENFAFRSHSKLPMAPCIIDLFYQQYFFT